MGKRGPQPGPHGRGSSNPRVGSETAELLASWFPDHSLAAAIHQLVQAVAQHAAWLEVRLPDAKTLAERLDALVLSAKRGGDPFVRALQAEALVAALQQQAMRDALERQDCRKAILAYDKTIKRLNGRVVGLGGQPMNVRGLLDQKLHHWIPEEETEPSLATPPEILGDCCK